MPAYLTVEEYVARFGNRETIVVTAEEPGATEPDTAKVEEAIEDAETLVDGYVKTGGYVVPMVDPPRLVLGWVANIAREALHKTRPTEAVKNAADLARSQLKDLAAGRLSLPLTTEQEETAISGDNSAMSSGDRAAPTFNPDQLDAYADLNLGAGGVANWRL